MGTSTDLTITPASVAKQQNGGACNETVDIPNVTDLQNNTSEIMTKTIDNNVVNEGTDTEGSTKGGLTSEERVLLREKKKARLQKEQEQTTCQNNQPTESLDGDPNDGHSSVAEGSDAEGEPGSEGSAQPKGPRQTRSGRRLGNLGKLDNNADNIQTDNSS